MNPNPNENVHFGCVCMWPNYVNQNAFPKQYYFLEVFKGLNEANLLNIAKMIKYNPNMYDCPFVLTCPTYDSLHPKACFSLTQTIKDWSQTFCNFNNSNKILKLEN